MTVTTPHSSWILSREFPPLSGRGLGEQLLSLFCGIVVSLFIHLCLHGFRCGRLLRSCLSSRVLRCPTPTIYHRGQAHDSIRLFNLTKQGIFERASYLYANGHSLRSIAQELNVSKTTTRQTLIEGGMSLRSHSRRQLKRGSSDKILSIRNAPYGYCLVGGRLVEDAREIHVVQKILALWQRGMSFGAIARKLNSQKIKPRKAPKWSQPVIGFIVQRHSNQNNQSKEKSKCLTDSSKSRSS